MDAAKRTLYDVDEGVALMQLDRPEVAQRDRHRDARGAARAPGESPATTTRSGRWSSPRPTTWASPPAPTSASSSTRRARCGGWQLFAQLYDQLTGFPKPTVAACHGACVGGGAEIAVACDMRIGGGNLRLRFPGAALGVPVGAARLVTLCGLSVAKYLLLSSKEVTADEALRWGIIAPRRPCRRAPRRPRSSSPARSPPTRPSRSRG